MADQKVRPPDKPGQASTPVPPGYTCAWCGAQSAGTSRSCPACGAPLDVKAVTTHSGWTELPAVRDMARIQFGQSSCQIEGTYVPVADMNLAAGDWVYFTHHVLLWKDVAVALNIMSLQGGWQRMFAGLPLVMMQAQGPGHIAFSRDAPGEMVALPLHPGQAVDVREHIFMVATGQVAYDWTYFPPLRLYLDRFTAPRAPGLLLLHGTGNVFVRHLAPHQTILVRPGALLFKDASVEMRLNTEFVSGVSSYGTVWRDRYHWLRLHGPGRVAAQSAYKEMEEPDLD